MSLHCLIIIFKMGKDSVPFLLQREGITTKNRLILLPHGIFQKLSNFYRCSKELYEKTYTMWIKLFSPLATFLRSRPRHRAVAFCERSGRLFFCGTII